MLPDNAPREYADSQTLWNAVDAAEKRRDAQTARRMLIVLPKELMYEQNLALIRDYCQQEFVSKGMICDLYYHDEGDGNAAIEAVTQETDELQPMTERSSQEKDHGQER